MMVSSLPSLLLFIPISSERETAQADILILPFLECGLPISYQSWMQITNLHIWLLSVRFRSLPAPLGRTYIQEIVNHYFIHAESLMRGRYNIKQNRLIKGYMRDMLYQYHGANMGYDEGLVSGSDAVLAAAVWRNLFGAGWGRMGGVKGKLNQDGKAIAADPKDPQSDKITPEEALTDLDVAAPPPPPSPLGAATATEAVAPQKVGNQAGGYHSGGSGLVDPLPIHEPAILQGVEAKEARFAVNIERLVKWIRSEVRRMENISDENVMNGAGIDRMSGKSNPGSLTDFSRI
jgi:cytochrome b pre-mRNA-processing protein 3